ncbi:MAG: TonB-dependent receptor [Bryobacterales bacterium]|nr:TonB-dependent receptor [Bryobacterales bacterium]MEB2360880.1 TonB-dependent receptor [Bryobacterales bacterium]
MSCFYIDRKDYWVAGICVALLLALAFWPAVLVGQTLLGSVVGLVTDATGAVIPDAKVTLTETRTGVQRVSLSNATGNYTFSEIPSGVYTVVISKTGFKEAAGTGITVTTQATVRFDAALQVGEMSQRVEVAAQAAALNTESAQLGDIRTRDEIVNLPLNTRSSMAYRYITSSNYDGGYIAGQRSYFGYYAVDGVSAMAPAWGAWSGPVLGMSMESVQDITFVTSIPSAEFGDVATVSVSTRSGTNDLHFSGFWEHSNNAFNAAGYFSHAKGKGPRLHEVGGSIAGPVYIPRLYNGKNRTFFFFNWENRISPGGYWDVQSVPTEKMRAGDFSELLSSGMTIYDPTTGNPFPGNIIPAQRISQVARNIQAPQYIPLPNFGGPGEILNNYRNFYSTKLTSYYPTARVDHNFRDNRDTISGRYNYRHDPEDGNLNGLPFFNKTQYRNATNAYLSETHLFSPTLVNEFRWGLTRDFSRYGGTSIGSDVVSDWGLEVPNMNLKQGLHGTPQVAFQNFTTLWSYADTGWDQITMDFVDNLTWSTGKHVIKTGFTYRHYKVDESSGDATDIFGALDFRSFGTQSPAGDGGFDYASFLLGIPYSSSTHDRSPDIAARYRTLAAYIQDDWRVSPRLTLNLGLRFETTSTPYDKNDMRFSFDPVTGALVVPNQKAIDTLVSPVFPKDIPIITAERAGFPSRSLLEADNTWAPRIGFAYRPLAKTVVRGGAGLFYSPLIHYAVIDPYAGGPFQLSQSFQNEIENGIPQLRFPNPFGGVGTFSGGIDIWSGAKKIRTPYTQQWNLTLERQFGEATVARASYRGHHTTQLLYYHDLNQPFVSNDPANQDYFRYPDFYQVKNYRNGGSEIGHLFEFEVQRRFTKGLTFQAGYTHAKVVTDNRGSDFIGSPEYSWDRKRDSGNENGISRHRATGSAIWELPFGTGQRFGSSLPKWVLQAFGNWQTSYVLALQSGQFLDPYCGDCPDTSYTRIFGGRPDLVGDPKLNNASIQRWFNPAAFAQPAFGTLGNSAPGVIVGPGLVNFNFGLFKYFNITETGRLQLRMTSTNFFNHPNFGNPNTDISSANAGRISGITGRGLGAGSRTIRLGARFDF